MRNPKFVTLIHHGILIEVDVVGPFIEAAVADRVTLRLSAAEGRARAIQCAKAVAEVLVTPVVGGKKRRAA